MFKNLKKFAKFLLIGSYQAKILYRIAHFFENKKLHIFAQIITRISIVLNSIEISPKAKLAKSVVISHGLGTVIGQGVTIGDNVWIRQNVTIGQKYSEIDSLNIYPTIKNNVQIGSGAVILGDIVVGENVIIGANSVVTKSIPDNCIVAGVPCKIIRKL